MWLVKHPRCPFCHEDVLSTDPKRACEACMGWHHRECWGEGGERCAACGATAEAPPAPAVDLSPQLEQERPSPLLRPACCEERPCSRHAVLSALLLTLGLEPLRRIARQAGLDLAPSCTEATAREVLRAVDVALPAALRGLTRAELEAACDRLGLRCEARTKRDLEGRLLSRAQLVRTVHALPLRGLRALADALEVPLSDRRWTERVRRDLLRSPTLGFAGLVGALRRDDLASACRRLGLPVSGTKAQLRRRLLDSAKARA